MRRFGRFELRALLHKSLRSMLWVVFDPAWGQDMFLMMPREKPNSEAAMLHWLKTVDAASRIHHPHLAHVIETGRVDPWPYVAYDRGLGETLDLPLIMFVIVMVLTLLQVILRRKGSA